jgi:hypothetical protein
MTSTTKAADNGSTTSIPLDVVAEPERLTGMARVREAQTYHTVSVLRDAMTEADRLCDQIHHAVSGAYFKDIRSTGAASDGRTARDLTSSPEIRGQAEEALNCLYTARNYLNDLLGYASEPPF